MGRPRTPAGRARVVNERLAEAFPGSAAELCALDHADPFQLLAATILSAQCTDERVNATTPGLFAALPRRPVARRGTRRRGRGPDPTHRLLPGEDPSLLGMADAVVERFDGKVPTRMEDLVTLPGVGRKTANVLRSVAFDLPGLPVDTHVQRLARRLGLTDETDPVKVEHALGAMVPAGERGVFSLRLILHGRATCRARSPRCTGCLLADICPSAGLGGAAAAA